MPGAPCDDDFDCEGLDSFCATGYCDQIGQTCAVEPQHEGENCSGNDDVCTVASVCSNGACVAQPLCDPVCSLCAAGGECVSMCGNPFRAESSSVTISDALYILRAGVHLEQCADCVCDVNDNGRVTAVDALIVERLVVRLPGQLVCPTSANPTTTTTLETTTTTLL
jgi:hypothetical protein